MNSLLFFVLSNICLFEEKIAMGDRTSKLGAEREQRQKTPRILLLGVLFFLFITYYQRS